jgi:TolB protein
MIDPRLPKVAKQLARIALAMSAVSVTAAAQRGTLGLAYEITYSQTYDPSLSPDGKRMVFISAVAGREQLFIGNSDGTGAVQITHDSIDHEDPSWSPDGQRIAFSYMRDTVARIAVMNIDGTGIALLTPPTMRAIHPTWTPDGKRILFCTDDDLHPPTKNPSSIYSLDPVTRALTLLISGGVNTFPVMSPDGRRIVFRRMIGEMNSEVFVANADGSDARNLTNHPAFDGWPSWSPDGTTIAFASNRNSSYQIWLMNADGSAPRRLANTEGRATAPQWSRDGRRIYFPNCVSVDFGVNCEIFAANVEPFER